MLPQKESLYFLLKNHDIHFTQKAIIKFGFFKENISPRLLKNRPIWAYRVKRAFEALP